MEGAEASYLSARSRHHCAEIREGGAVAASFVTEPKTVPIASDGVGPDRDVAPSVTDLPFDKCGVPRLQERMGEARETGGLVEDENDPDAANGMYGVWRVAVDYMKGDEPAVRADSVESAIRRANEAIPRRGRAHMILAVKADVPQGWVSQGAITCGCDRWCHGAQNTSAKDVVTSFRKDTERHDAARRHSLRR